MVTMLFPSLRGGESWAPAAWPRVHATPSLQPEVRALQEPCLEGSRVFADGASGRLVWDLVCHSPSRAGCALGTQLPRSCPQVGPRLQKAEQC